MDRTKIFTHLTREDIEENLHSIMRYIFYAVHVHVSCPPVPHVLLCFHIGLRLLWNSMMFISASITLSGPDHGINIVTQTLGCLLKLCRSVSEEHFILTSVTYD